MTEGAKLWSGVGATVLVDQLTKQLVVEHLRLGQPVAVVSDVIAFRYARNPLGVFHILAGFGRADRTLILVVLPLCMLACLLFALRKLDSWNGGLAIALSLIIGGAISNLVDRWLRHSVVDFVLVRVGAVRLAPFNLADLVMVIGIGLLLVALAQQCRPLAT